MKLSNYYESTNLTKMATAPWLRLSLTLIIGLILGAFLFSGDPTEKVSHDETTHQEGTIWTCSMHPQIHLDEPGQCPICFMDLIPLDNKLDNPEPLQLSLSATASALAQVTTSVVRQGLAHGEIQVSGKIESDETRIKSISAWFPGRLERLYVDYTGITVRMGDHLLDIYSPDLYAAQEELLQAHRRVKQSEAGSSGSQNAQSGYEAAREKTRLMGLSDSQIESILRHGKARAVQQINSPITGIVTHKNAVEGKYVKTGDPIYTIVDLSKVWLNLEAYEQDLPWLAYGQALEFTVAGLPGRIFNGTISYVDPLVDPMKRSVSLRAVLPNAEGLLKPGMLAEATIEVHLNGKGEVVTPDLAGKWTCPMHPEVLSDKAGQCDICGMNLVPVETLTGRSALISDALLIPASAVLKTGKRAIVYLEVSQGETRVYELREIVLGPRVGGDYIILDGLKPGDRVVTNGNFKIDSAMQIAGKQSMMSPPEALPQSTGSPEFLDALTPLYNIYLELQTGLAADKMLQCQDAYRGFVAALNAIDEQKVKKPESWSDHLKTFKKDTKTTDPATTIASLRSQFDAVSKFILTLQKLEGHPGSEILYEVFCPMAFDNTGASWLQTDRKIRNPYFGSAMLSCGEIKQTYLPASVTHD